MTELTPLLIFLGFMFSIIFLVATPLIGALVLSMFTRLFKFKKTDYKTALVSVLIAFGVMMAVSSALSTLFLDKLVQWQSTFTVLALLISFIAGLFVVYKFYKESFSKCFWVWVLTYVAGIVVFIIIVMLIVLIFGQFIRK